MLTTRRSTTSAVRLSRAWSGWWWTTAGGKGWQASGCRRLDPSQSIPLNLEGCCSQGLLRLQSNSNPTRSLRPLCKSHLGALGPHSCGCTTSQGGIERPPRCRELWPRWEWLWIQNIWLVWERGECSALILPLVLPVHYVHFVKYDDTVSFYDAVSDTIWRRGGQGHIYGRRGGYSGIFWGKSRI